VDAGCRPADRRTSRASARSQPSGRSGGGLPGHLLHIYEKLGVRDRAGAVGEAYRRRLLS
jgi:hypothetical protein